MVKARKVINGTNFAEKNVRLLPTCILDANFESQWECLAHNCTLCPLRLVKKGRQTQGGDMLSARYLGIPEVLGTNIFFEGMSGKKEKCTAIGQNFG